MEGAKTPGGSTAGRQRPAAHSVVDREKDTTVDREYRPSHVDGTVRRFERRERERGPVGIVSEG